MTEDIIARDLAALGENSRRELPSLDEVPALRRTDIYRDDRHGAEGRRDALAEERRRELAHLPLALAQVYAHRVARITAGGVAMFVAFATLAILGDYDVGHRVLRAVPLLPTATYVAIAAFAVLASYVLGLRYGERAFERAMRAAIAPQGDVYADLDHLARGPLEIARARLAKLDRAAVAIGFIGLTTVVLVLGFAFLATGVGHESLLRGALRDIVGLHRLAPEMNRLIAFVLVACVLGWVLGRGLRQRGMSGKVVGVASHVGCIAVAAVLAFYAWTQTSDGLVADGPIDSLPLIGWYSVATMQAAAWAILAVRRREQARLG